MKIATYIATLLPSFAKETVTDDIKLTRTELREFTIPAYEAAAPLFKGVKFKSPEMERDSTVFSRIVKEGKGDNIVGAINDGFKTILQNLDEVEALIVKTYNQEIAGAGFTYLKANLLQFQECVAFVSKYARKYLAAIYIYETAMVDDGSTRIAESLSPAELEWLTVNFVSFCTAFNIVTCNTVKVRNQLDDIPDIVATVDNASTLSSTVGEAKLDPFQMKLIPIWLNPVYHVGMFVAEWQADRYKAAKEEVRLLQMRKLNLEKAREGKPDASLQKQIAYMETRIQDINFKIAKMEKHNGH